MMQPHSSRRLRLDFSAASRYTSAAPREARDCETETARQRLKEQDCEAKRGIRYRFLSANPHKLGIVTQRLTIAGDVPRPGSLDKRANPISRAEANRLHSPGGSISSETAATGSRDRANGPSVPAP